jgi:hypothetical protein
LDLDEIIVSKEGISINDIFKTKGEIYFRRLEHQIFKDLTIKNAGEKRWKQTLYLNYTGFKETDPYTYYTETLGLVASGRSGRIFTDWKKIKFQEWEEISGDLFYGVDFGYADDETTLTAIKWVKKDEKKESVNESADLARMKQFLTRLNG